MVKPTCRQSSTSPMEHVSDTSSSSSSTSSKYRGVRKRKWGKWVSEIRLPNSRERIWLGSYDSEEKAAKAFDAALYCLRGSNANLNFPENPPEIIGGRSLNRSEIRVVATRFANQVYGHETNNNDDSNNEIYVGTESSSPVSAAMEIENAIQSSFLSMLDTKYQGMSDYGVYSPMSHHLFGDQLYTPPLPVDENIDDDKYGGDGFSQSSSFLWNF